MEASTQPLPRLMVTTSSKEDQPNPVLRRRNSVVLGERVLPPSPKKSVELENSNEIPRTTSRTNLSKEVNKDDKLDEEGVTKNPMHVSATIVKEEPEGRTFGRERRFTQSIYAYRINCL
jgi:hypothetical protein